jgi:predicted transcriptional regulator
MEKHINRNAATGSQSDPERVKVRSKTATALSEAGFGDVYVLSPEIAAEVLTPRRRRIVEALAEEEFSSQRELARYLDLEPGNVQRDVAMLIDHGLVGREDDGRSKRPYLKHDTVIVEPVVSSSPPIDE